jgi:hypothetical protein
MPLVFRHNGQRAYKPTDPWDSRFYFEYERYPDRPETRAPPYIIKYKNLPKIKLQQKQKPLKEIPVQELEPATVVENVTQPPLVQQPPRMLTPPPDQIFSVPAPSLPTQVPNVFASIVNSGGQLLSQTANTLANVGGQAARSGMAAGQTLANVGGQLVRGGIAAGQTAAQIVAPLANPARNIRQLAQIGGLVASGVSGVASGAGELIGAVNRVSRSGPQSSDIIESIRYNVDQLQAQLYAYTNRLQQDPRLQEASLEIARYVNSRTAENERRAIQAVGTILGDNLPTLPPALTTVIQRVIASSNGRPTINLIRSAIEPYLSIPNRPPALQIADMINTFERLSIDPSIPSSSRDSTIRPTPPQIQRDQSFAPVAAGTALLSLILQQWLSLSRGKFS